ncbi:hypothetical protein [Citricoccus sp. GCM10030269]|uniref:HAAS signaling domain-containing protein n=1 Tax=Citricoccus sp. GCM10030269 TaxID=3273388 RepID=UPI0036231AE2
MSSLTARYIDQVVSHLPEGQRADIQRELSALISDMLDERLATGTGAGAEREVLEELGDPSQLAAKYRNTPNYLIGPELYPVYLRTLRWLIPVVLLISLVANIVVYTATEAEAELGAMIGAVIGPMINAVFIALGAVTAFFWVFERVASPRDRGKLAKDAGRRWSVDELELEIVNAREARSEAVVSLVFVAFMALLPVIPTSFLYVGHLNDGGSFLNPALWAFWLPAYYVLLALVAALAVWTIVRGAVSRAQIVARVVLDVAAALFLTMAVITQEIIDPAIDSGIMQTSGLTDWVDVLYLVVIWLVALWDLYVCYRYWRTLGTTKAATPGSTVTSS